MRMFLLLLLCFSFFVFVPTSGEEAREDSAFSSCVTKLVADLKDDGNISYVARGNVYSLGATGLALSAILRAGEQNSEVVEKTLKSITRRAEKDELVFSLACALVSMCDAEEFTDRNVSKAIKSAADRLVKSQSKKGVWGYGVSAEGGTPGDMSVLALVLNSLDKAQRQGVKVSTDVWEKSLAFLKDTQHEDGGWGYLPKHPASLGMTVAGLTCSMICMKNLAIAHGIAPDKESLAKALGWVDKSGLGIENDRMPFYDLYVLTLLNEVSGYDFFSGSFVGDIASKTFQSADIDKLSGADLAFIVLCLGHFSKPYVVSKFVFSDSGIPSRPFDLPIALSKNYSHPCWQSIRGEIPGNVPVSEVCIITSEGRLKLSKAHRNVLSRNGSRTFVIGYCASNLKDFRESFEKEMEAVFGELEFRKIRSKHSMFLEPDTIPLSGGLDVFLIVSEKEKLNRGVLIAVDDFGEKLTSDKRYALCLSNAIHFARTDRGTAD
ncbi:MAG: prenyltransferase/squalene oxidase repeat-containing protein [Planctomycetota bacterium]|nr:prenyltransferase/squalene oxidase repeat-containing protein [Planctomycetota bacterium]